MSEHWLPVGKFRGRPPRDASKGRRAGLCEAAETRPQGAARTARVEVDRRTAQVLTRLTAEGLTSADARAFLDSLPGIEQLLPAVALTEIEATTFDRALTLDDED